MIQGAFRHIRTPAAVAGVLVVAAVLLRLWAMSKGHNFDFRSYLIVGELAADGENVYANTSRYNYGPVWFTLLGGFYRIAELTPWPVGVFRIEIVALLTAVDLAIARILWVRFSGRAAVLYLLSPIAIVITGFHNQFDSLALLIGLVAMLVLSRADNEGRPKLRYVAFGLLGVSLMTKHVLFALPGWLAVRRAEMRDRVLAVVIPIGVFGLGFLPFWSSGAQGIRENVFGYRSFENAPLLNGLSDSPIDYRLAFTVFLLALAALGIRMRHRDLVESFLVYTVAVVVFAPAVSNQVLAIPGAAIAAYFNVVYGVYLLLGGIFLAVSHDGLRVSWLMEIPPMAWWDDFERFGGWEILIVTLAVGFVIHLWQRGILGQQGAPTAASRGRPGRHSAGRVTGAPADEKVAYDDPTDP